MSARCREGVQSSNEKLLLLLGLNAHKLMRRICGFGQGGGGRGTGIEPSPRSPKQSRGDPSGHLGLIYPTTAETDEGMAEAVRQFATRRAVSSLPPKPVGPNLGRG
jgi:hypothetical protein